MSAAPLPPASGELPLRGTRVVDLLDGPMGAIGRQLAELGADVVRIEPETGASDRRQGAVVDGLSLDFVANNLGKRSTTPEHLPALAKGADIILAPPGFDAEGYRAGNPALVVMTVSPFGQIGRCVDWQGSGPVYHALSGELSRSGIPGRAPLLPPADLAHVCAAAQASYLVLLAYYHAIRTGRGDHLDFSILSGAAQALDPGYGIAGSATAGVPASRLPRGRIDARFQYPIIPCRDGFVRVCILAAKQWRGMFEWMGRPEEFADPSFDQIATRFASETLLPAIGTFFADMTRSEIETTAQRFGVPAAAVLDLDEALLTEQIQARQAFRPVSLTPDLEASFPDGVLEIDGVRMGFRSGAPLVEGNVEWLEPRLEQSQSYSGDRPLADLKVLDLGVIIVGAEGGRLLADQGADVVKVESSAYPDGSRQNRTGSLISPTFVAGHRNKRGLGLNLRDPEGKALLLKLVEQSDILLSNFKGGTLNSLGLDYETLRTINPRLIMTDSSAFGPTGPWSKRMGYGPLVRASAGLTMQWRYPGEPDSFSDTVTVYPDHVAGRISLIGVMALLIRRLRTGEGGYVGVSQAEVMLSHMASEIAARTLERAGHAVTRHQTASAVYACAGDDDWCVVTVRDVIDERAISGLTGGKPLDAWLAEQDAEAAMEALQGAGVPAGMMLRVSELPDFDFYRDRAFYRQERHPYLKYPFTVEAAPIRSEHLPEPPETPAPMPGEHTVEYIRERLGLSEQEVEALIEAGVLEQYKAKEIAA